MKTPQTDKSLSVIEHELRMVLSMKQTDVSSNIANHSTNYCLTSSDKIHEWFSECEEYG